MGKKYIINFEDNPGIAPNREKYYTCCEIPWWVAAECTLSKLTPYTEPDLDAIKQEEYEKGYKTAKVQCNIQAEKDLREVWEAARTFMSEVIDARFRNNFMVEIFECDNAMGAMKVYSVSECIKKIRQYEQRQEEDGLRQNIQTIVDQCGYSLDEIAEVLAKMKEEE